MRPIKRARSAKRAGSGSVRTGGASATEASATARTRLFRSTATAHRRRRFGRTETFSHPRPLRRSTKVVLFVAFAFTIMAAIVVSALRRST
jgi:hypothetical protein